MVATYDAATSANLSISGSTLTINPTAHLSPGTSYKVEFAAGSIKDLVDNPYAGTTTYNFTTAATTPAPTTSYTVPGTLGNDFMVPSAGNMYMGGGGNDTYIISPYTLTGTVTAKVADTEGVDVIQLVPGMTIASSLFYANAVQLTLSNGATLQVLAAGGFDFQLGANATVPLSAPSLSYAQFAAELGVSSLPASGFVTGTPNYVVGGGGGGGGGMIVDLSSGTVSATAAAEEFRYDFKLVNGRITKAGDGEVSISGFDVSQDKLVFVNTTNSTTYTEAQFKALAGVSITEDPFANNTTISFDPLAGVNGSVTLLGIQDAALAQIVLETV